MGLRRWLLIGYFTIGIIWMIDSLRYAYDEGSLRSQWWAYVVWTLVLWPLLLFNVVRCLARRAIDERRE